MALHSKFINGILRFFSGATNVLDIDPAGYVDVKNVGGLKIAGTAIASTAAQIDAAALGSGITNAVAGVGASYKIARGIVTPTSASHTVVTGLSTVVAAHAVLQGLPTLTHMFTEADIGDQAGAPAAGSILVKSSKPTGTGDVTPISSTTPWGVVAWIAIGT